MSVQNFNNNLLKERFFIQSNQWIIHPKFAWPWKDLSVSNYDVALIKLPKDIYETGMNNALVDVDRTEEWPEDFDDLFLLQPESSTLSNITCVNQLLVEDPNDDLDDDWFVVPPGGHCTPCGDGCVNAACLPTEPVTGGKACWIAGWGKTSEHAYQNDRLYELGINTYSDEYCENNSLCAQTGDCPFEKTDDVVCIGIPDEDGDGVDDMGKGACRGDSGGPLICDVNGKYVLTGLTSWAPRPCAQEGEAQRYVRVHHYLRHR